MNNIVQLPRNRMPPHNIEAEKAMLGAILVNNRAFERVAEAVSPGHFIVAAHGTIYAAIDTLIGKGTVADPITLRRYFEQEQALAEIGGAKYLDELADSATTIINAGEYGRLIHDLWAKRQVIAAAEQALESAYTADVAHPATAVIEEIEKALTDIAADRTENQARPLGEGIEAVIGEIEAAGKNGRPAGVPTGFADLDKLLGGLQAGDVIVLAGRPSMGKTSLAIDIAAHAGAIGIAAGFFELEMSRASIQRRLISRATGIGLNFLRDGTVGAAEWEGILAAQESIKKSPIILDDTGGLSMAGIRIRARRMIRKHKIGLLLIDHLQLIRPDDRYAGHRTQEVTSITREMKELAKELDIPVVVLSQLSRQVESRDPPVPRLSDLRESGSIEQDADIVMFVYRQEYYLKRTEPKRRDGEKDGVFLERQNEWLADCERAQGVATVLVDKARNGPVGKVDLHFDEKTTRFSNLHRG